MRHNNFDPSLCLVTNGTVAAKRGSTVEKTVLLAVAGGATLVQIREKEMDRKKLADLVARVKPFTLAAGVPLIVNDSVETALKVGADGAHVGQSDLAASVARKWLGSKMILGVSVYTVEEALRAQAVGADYLGVGPVFATKTKTDAQPPMGMERLGIIAQAVSIPVIAIGGVVHSNAAAIVRTGIDGVAVISAIIDQPDPAQATQILAGIVRSAKAGIGRGSLVLA